MNKNGRFRNNKVYFTQVSNEILRDNTISLKAKGLYALIQSYITLENFTLYKNFLKKHCKEKETSFESAWKELKENGYLIQYKMRDKETNLFYYEYELLDKKSHTPKTHRVGHPRSGEHGVYNNTEPNNTDLNNTYSLHFPTENDIWEEWQEEYISAFLTIRDNYISKQHKRISSSNVEYINQVIQSLSNNNIDIEVFKEGVNSYFSNLDKDNDGDIVYFMQVCQKRIFDIDYKDIVKK